MNEELNKRARQGILWNTPIVRKQGDPNIKHPNWNPHENEENELEFN